MGIKTQEKSGILSVQKSGNHVGTIPENTSSHKWAERFRATSFLDWFVLYFRAYLKEVRGVGQGVAVKADVEEYEKQRVENLLLLNDQWNEETRKIR